MNFQNTGYTIKQVQQQIHTVMEDALRPLSLSLSQYNVLKTLETASAVTGAELARKAFVTPQTMHTILTTMERKGLLARSAIVGNSKSFNIVITPRGGKVLADAENALGTVFDTANKALMPEEHAELGRLLQQLALGLKGVS